MEDQFGGRTDDDLFFDDFEPVADSQPIETVDVASPPPPAPPPAPPSAAVATPPVKQPKPAPAPPKHFEPPSQPKSRLPTAPRGGLANSRFADTKPAPAPRAPRQQNPAQTTAPAAPSNNNNAHPDAPTGPAAQTQQASPPAPANKSNSPAPVAPQREKTTHVPVAGGGNTALNAEARLQSGANPRTKLTEAELAVKMEQMRILNAETTRKFEQAEQDERSHAEAYARGMEAARKRKQAEAEQRRRGEEERKRMDDERAKNRERKLKAMSLKEGGWDEGKEALAAEEERRGFLGANGGIRGARSSGMSGSIFAGEGDEGERYGDRYDRDERRVGRGRGRGGRGQGRGGRGGRGGYGGDFEPREPASNGARDTKNYSATEPKAPAINAEEFPALPRKGKLAETSPPVLSPLGRWDDEMEAFDAKMKSDAEA